MDKKERNKKFANALRRLRVKLLLTQVQMASALKVPPSTYKSWEQGVCLPTFEAYSEIILLAKSVYMHKDIETSYIEVKGVRG